MAELQRGKIRNARAQVQYLTLRFGVKCHIAGHFRPWADKTHVAEENIEDLGEFVEFCPPEQAPDLSDPVVIPYGDGTAQLFGVDNHGPELEDIEWPSAQAHTLLPEYYRAPVFGFNQDGNNRHERPKQEQPQDTTKDIQKTFHG